MSRVRIPSLAPILNWALAFYIGKDGKILYIDKEVKTVAHGSDIVRS